VTLDEVTSGLFGLASSIVSPGVVELAAPGPKIGTLVGTLLKSAEGRQLRRVGNTGRKAVTKQARPPATRVTLVGNALIHRAAQLPGVCHRRIPYPASLVKCNTAARGGGDVLQPMYFGFRHWCQPGAIAAFRALYNVPTNVPIFGPWSGKLDNAGETIELAKSKTSPIVTSSNVTVPYVWRSRLTTCQSLPGPDERGWRGRLAATAGIFQRVWQRSGETGLPLCPQPVTCRNRSAIAIHGPELVVMNPPPPPPRAQATSFNTKNNLSDAAWTSLRPLHLAGGASMVLTDTNSTATLVSIRVHAQ